MKDKIKEDLKNSMREKNAVKTGALRMLISAISNKEIEKRYGLSKANPSLTDEELSEQGTLNEAEIQSVVGTEVKKRREALEAFEKGGRTEMAATEKAE